LKKDRKIMNSITKNVRYMSNLSLLTKIHSYWKYFSYKISIRLKHLIYWIQIEYLNKENKNLERLICQIVAVKEEHQSRFSIQLA